MEPRYSETQWPRLRAMVFWGALCGTLVIFQAISGGGWMLVVPPLVVGLLNTLGAFQIRVDDRAVRLRFYGVPGGTIPLAEIKGAEIVDLGPALVAHPTNPSHQRRGVRLTRAGKKRPLSIGSCRPEQLVAVIERARSGAQAT